ncbi:hypothetical protein [Mucilaginibacter sp. NFX135]|uniref:hypothetical protein n=1 Tax=Mucilaginibacter sp. NFX135 TaxID=3402687 RepID=UPI003AFA0190
MLPVLSLIRRLPVTFDRLRASLLAWNSMGHGLWPVRYWSPAELDEFLQLLYVAVGERLVAALPRPAVLYRWQVNASAEVCSGPELLGLLGSLAATLAQPLATEDESDLLQLTEQVYWSLLGLLHPEEPGEVSVDELLAGH